MDDRHCDVEHGPRAFPMLMLVALLAVFRHEAYGLLLYNAALWKVGFPEVTVQAISRPLLERFSSGTTCR